jgi:hypothetical protein
VERLGGHCGKRQDATFRRHGHVHAVLNEATGPARWRVLAGSAHDPATDDGGGVEGSETVINLSASLRSVQARRWTSEATG